MFGLLTLQLFGAMFWFYDIFTAWFNLTAPISVISLDKPLW